MNERHEEAGHPRLGLRYAPYAYTGFSLALAFLFWLVTGDSARYTSVARYGGSAWVFLLSMIISMPLVVSWFKRQPRPEASRRRGVGGEA